MRFTQAYCLDIWIVRNLLITCTFGHCISCISVYPTENLFCEKMEFLSIYTTSLMVIAEQATTQKFNKATFKKINNRKQQKTAIIPKNTNFMLQSLLLIGPVNQQINDLWPNPVIALSRTSTSCARCRYGAPYATLDPCGEWIQEKSPKKSSLGRFNKMDSVNWSLICSENGRY